jgi:hypothetical protein
LDFFQISFPRDVMMDRIAFSHAVFHLPLFFFAEHNAMARNFGETTRDPADVPLFGISRWDRFNGI